MGSRIKPGDYVLATYQKNGTSYSAYAVGFVQKIVETREGRFYTIEDNEGNTWPPPAYTGMRKAMKITQEEGRILVEEIFPVLAKCPGSSLWKHLSIIRKEAKANA